MKSAARKLIDIGVYVGIVVGLGVATFAAGLLLATVVFFAVRWFV